MVLEFFVYLRCSMVFPARLKHWWEIIAGIIESARYRNVPAIVPRINALVRTIRSNFLGALEKGAICIMLNRIDGRIIAIPGVVVASRYPSRTPLNIISSAIGDRIRPTRT